MGLIEKIRDAGVVGAGGAGFPTDRKLNCKAEVFIVNGLECEPLLRTDRHIMECYAPEIVKTASIIQKSLGTKRAIIALKKHYKKAVQALNAAIKSTSIELYLSDSFYPAGDEQNLVYSILGRTVPTGGIPLDVGCVVDNVGTVLNISRALEDKPVTEKIVTVGGSVTHPVTASCAIGTPISILLDAAGGPKEECSYIIGGPLMGRVTDDISEPVTKTTGGILAIPKHHTLLMKKQENSRDRILARAICCQCSMCTQLCPRNAMGLDVQPHKVMRAFALGDDSLLGDVNGIFSCCDCGICTFYACNFGLKPNKAMQQAKAKLQRSGLRAEKKVRFENTDEGFNNKHLPTERLLWRLDIKKYDTDTPLRGFVDSDNVRIPLKMHIGNPDTPLVTVGQHIKKGELIAKPQGMGANIHASIDGIVSDVNEEFIEIRK